MKKLIIIIIGLFVISGCTTVDNLNYDEIINDKIASPAKLHNIRRKGYSYYLPIGLGITSSEEYNEIISTGRNRYYLYVDVVSYYNKVEFNYEENSSSYYSKSFQEAGKKGYLEINKEQNDKYLIEIMYNYAKIELIVDENDIKLAIVNSISILSSITYNDIIIENLMGQDVLNFSEEEFDIFKTKGTESDILELFESEEAEEEIPDPDLIN